MKQFVILRHGQPFLFGLELLGVTWLSPLILERPLEKLGGGLELYWDGELIDSDKVGVTRVIAHWKRALNKRAKRTGVPLSELISTEPWEDEELAELLTSLKRG